MLVEFLTWCVQLFQKWLSLMLQLEVVSGVSLLHLCIAMFVLAAIINAFLLRSR